MSLVKYTTDEWDYCATSIGEDVHLPQTVPAYRADSIGLGMYEGKLHVFNEDDCHYWSIGILPPWDRGPLVNFLKKVKIEVFGGPSAVRNNTRIEYWGCKGTVKKRKDGKAGKTWLTLEFKLCGKPQSILLTEPNLDSVIAMFNLRETKRQ